MSALPISRVAVRVHLRGIVTAVSADGQFTLLLTGAAERGGTASGPQLRRLGRFLGRGVLVLGSESADGTLAVDGVLPADGAFVVSTDDWPLSPSETAELAARRGTVLGGWPGNETDEEIEAALRGER